MVMVTQAMQELLVASGRVRVALELNVIRLTWLVGGGVLAFIQKSPMLFVLTIGLIQVPAYCFASWRLYRLNLIKWRRELSALLAMVVGFGLGSAASYAGQILLPNL